MFALMKKSLVFMIILLIGCFFVLKAQKPVPTGYFISPLGIDLSVTGTFGEVRPNHFHSGIDFQVQKKEGLPVYAVADGWVSRIKISPVGFGNALYIDHPNGFTSVYGHLFDYSDTLRKYAHIKQYELKSFDIDIFPANKKDTLWVSKGQLIGYAGNSGSSFGAHLHFELRNTETERIINPLLFGLECKDLYPPYIDFITLTPVDEGSLSTTISRSTKYNIRKHADGEYRLAAADTLQAFGKFALGVQAFDFLYSPSDRNGWYSMTMLLDKGTLFSMKADSFAFNESRNVNASIEYVRNYEDGSRVMSSRKLPGNTLEMHKVRGDNGILNLMDSAVHEVVVTVADYVGNKTTLRFWIESRYSGPVVQVPDPLECDTVLAFSYSKDNEFRTTALKIFLPAGCLYDDCFFQYSKKLKSKGLYSDLHILHRPEVPLHRKMKVSIKADQLPARLQPKALLVRIDREGKRSAAGGVYHNGYVTTDTYFFDSYAIAVDTTPPTIKPLHERYRSAKQLRLTVSDNFSGIDDYKAEINGKWALVEWDPKNRLMVYHYDELLQQGKNRFRIQVWDEKGNSSVYSHIITIK
jgi:hypothetical protein